MPQTPARPQSDTDLEVRQYAASVRASAVRVRAGAEQILIDLAHGRLASSSGRQLAAEVVALCEAQAALKAAGKTAARERAAA